MYTSLNSITADDAHYTLAVDEYGLLEKAFLEFRLNKWQAEDLKKYIFNNRVMISGRIYGQQYRRQGGYELIPDEKLNFIVSQYEEFLFYSLEDMLIKYRVDYLVWDIKENPQWDIDQYQFFKQIYEIGDIKIYKLI